MLYAEACAAYTKNWTVLDRERLWPGQLSDAVIHCSLLAAFKNVSTHLPPYKASRALQEQEDSLGTHSLLHGMALHRHKQLLLISPFGSGNQVTKPKNYFSWGRTRWGRGLNLAYSWDVQDPRVWNFTSYFPWGVDLSDLASACPSWMTRHKTQLWLQHSEKSLLREKINILSTHTVHGRLSFIIHNSHKAKGKARTSLPACFIMTNATWWLWIPHPRVSFLSCTTQGVQLLITGFCVQLWEVNT